MDAKTVYGREWLRWFPAAAQNQPGRWHLQRFESVTAEGKPVGKAVIDVSPSNQVRTYRSEEIAQGVANLLNKEQGR